MKSPTTSLFQCCHVFALSRARILFQASAFSVFAVALLVFATGARAATITWVIASNISADTDIATSGTLKYAYTWGAAATVNGVAFTQTTSGTAAGTDVTLGSFGTRNGTTFGSAGSPYNSLSSSYQGIIQGGAYGGTAAGTVTLNNLVSGHNYTVQIWVQDGRVGTGGAATRYETITGTGTPTLYYYAGGTSSSPAGGLGQYAVGTFTADATTQAITITPGGGSSAGLQINAILVRDGVSGVWNTASSGLNWGTVGNWLNSTIADATGSTADFSKVNIVTDPTLVNLDSSRTLGNLIFGDTVTASAAGWSLTGNTLTLSATTPTITVNALGSGKAASIASILAGSAGLTKTGVGELKLVPATVETFTGGLTANQGQLDVSWSSALTTANLINSGNALTLGGGIISLQAGTSQSGESQTFASTTLNAGANVVGIDAGGTTSFPLTLGAVARNAGSTLNIALTYTGTRNIASSSWTSGNPILDSGVAYATLYTSASSTLNPPASGDDWAAWNGTTAVAPTYTASTTTTLSGNATVATGVDTTLAANSTPTSVRFSLAQARTITATGYTLTTGGILVGSGVGNNLSTITGGTLQSAASAANKDLVIINNDNSSGLTISSVIANATAGATGLTKSGAGLLTLSGVNTYTGPTYISSGTLSISADSGLGTAPGSATANMIVLNGGSLSGGFNGTLSANRGMTLGANGGTILTPVISLTYLGIIAGSGPLTINTTSGGILFGGASTYTGGTTLSGTGTLYPIVSSTGSPGSPISGPFGTGTLTLNGCPMRPSTGVATDPIIMGNPVVIAANAAFPSVVGEKSLLFSGPVTLAGGSRTLTASIGANVSTESVTFSGAIGDGGNGYGLTQNGTGTGKLILSGNNTYSGPTVISSGILQIGNGGTSGSLSTSSTITDSGTLAFNRSDNIAQGTAFANNITGTGALSKSGAGKLTLGANGYSGQTTVSGGTLTASDVASFGTSSQINVSGGGTLQLATDSSVNAYNLSVGSSTTGNLVLDRATAGVAFTENLGILYLGAASGAILNVTAGANVTSGTPIASFSSIILSGGSGAGSSTIKPVGTSVAITGGVNTSTGTAKTLILDGTSSGNSIAGNVTDGSNPVSLTKASSSTWTLNGANNNYSGNTLISGGTLVLGSGATIPNSSSISVANGATLDVTASGFTVGTLQTLTGAGTVSGAVTNNGKITPGSSGVGTLTIGLLTMSVGSTLDFEFPVSGANDLVNVTTSGGVTLNGGAFKLYQTGTTTAFTQNGTYNLVQYSGTLNGSVANLSVANGQTGKTYVFSANGTYVQLTIGDAPTPEYWGVDANGSWSTAGNWNPTTIPNVQFASANFGGGSTTFTGPHTVTLDGNNIIGSLTFNTVQPFTINQGSSGSLLFDNGNGTALITDTLGNHTVNAAIALPTSGASVSLAASTSLSLNGTISGTSGIVESGSGTLNLGGANTYSGGTTLSAGQQLNINYGGSSSANSALGTGALTIGGGTLDNTSSGDVTLLPSIAQFWNGNFTYAGSAHNLNLGTGTVTLSANRQVTVTANTLTVGGNISGTYSLTKAGSGTLALSGANTYSGGTTISAGTLSLSGANTYGAGVTTVGGASGNAVLNIANGANVSATPGTGAGLPSFPIGNASGANGVINVSGGSLTISGANSGELNLNFGSATGGYGFLGMASGTLSTLRLQLGGQSVGSTTGTGVALISGGTTTVSEYLLLSRNTGAYASLTVASGGTLNHKKPDGSAASASISLCYGGGRGELNLTGGTLDSTGNSLSVKAGNTGTATGIVNLNSGTLIVNSFLNLNSGTAFLNFNGGSLKAGTNATPFIPSAMTAVNVYSGGATIDDGGYAITNTAALVAPGNTGLTSISMTAGTGVNKGSGYIGAPYVSITGGTLPANGSPATAIANMVDDGTGNGTYKVDSITITCPGVYTDISTIVISFIGGGGSGAVAGTISTAATTSGGLTKLGTGRFALSGANTYAGNTTVSAGTLALIGSGSIANSTSIVVGGSAVFDISGLSSAFTLGSSQILSNNAVAAIICGANNCSAGTVSLVYDGVNPSFIITNGGMTISSSTTIKVNNTGAALLPGTYKIIAKATAGAAGLVAGTMPGSVTITGGQPSGGTPSLSIVNGELYLTVGGNSSVGYTGSSFTYNGSAQTPAIAISGSNGAATTNYVGTGATTYSGVNAPTNVGAYYVSNTVASDNNYFGTTNGQAFTISPATASVTADAKNKSYGALNPTLTATVAGTVSGDTLNYTLTTDATQFSAVGLSNILVTLGSNPNYLVLTTNGTLTINQANPFVGASSTNNPSGYKDSVAFLATLPVDATGNVVFTSTNGAFSTNLLTAGNAISLSITNLPRGTNLITVTYNGDTNYLSTSTNFSQIVTNHPPVVNLMTLTRTAGLALTIALADVATNWSDADGDTVLLTGVTLQSTNGVNLYAGGWVTNLDGSIETTNGGFIGYPNSPNVADQLSYAVSDGYGGTNIGYINILITNTVSGTNSIAGIAGGNPTTVTAYGIPGYTYVLERATNLVPAVWVDVETNQAATNGVITISDYFSDLGSNAPSSAYYRLKWQ